MAVRPRLALRTHSGTTSSVMCSTRTTCVAQPVRSQKEKPRHNHHPPDGAASAAVPRGESETALLCSLWPACRPKHCAGWSTGAVEMSGFRLAVRCSRRDSRQRIVREPASHSGNAGSQHCAHPAVASRPRPSRRGWVCSRRCIPSDRPATRLCVPRAEGSRGSTPGRSSFVSARQLHGSARFVSRQPGVGQGQVQRLR
jgi:hypothetical protein